MKSIFRLLRFFTNPQDQADAMHRYKLGLEGIKRCNQEKKDIAKDGDDMVRHFNYAIDGLRNDQKPETAGVQLWQKVIKAQQAFTKSQLLEADKRLIVYRDMVLRKGKI
ncbi:MAG: hypothetical protein JWP57_3187 [Spirosoma sp.]|nr:hypothetical protein [Spirosoma sp.]